MLQETAGKQPTRPLSCSCCCLILPPSSFCREPGVLLVPAALWSAAMTFISSWNYVKTVNAPLREDKETSVLQNVGSMATCNQKKVPSPSYQASSWKFSKIPARRRAMHRFWVFFQSSNLWLQSGKRHRKNK